MTLTETAETGSHYDDDFAPEERDLLEHVENSRLTDAFYNGEQVDSYVITPTIQGILTRAKRYLLCSYPVHLRGSAGTGKTAMAFRLAQSFDRPIVFLTGDASLTKASLIGGYNGSEIKRTQDQYISSVKKLHVEQRQLWQNEVLATACLEGHTLIYDEFNRSTPEANNVLLPILQERILPLPQSRTMGERVRVHPEFRAIFTSNNVDYIGTHATQDALTDRLLTIDLDYFDEDTEISIVLSRSDLDEEDAVKIVRAVRDYRESGAYDSTPTMRASLMIADIASRAGLPVCHQDPGFVDLCLDVLVSKSVRKSSDKDREQYAKVLKQLIALHCP